ncbi:hypothetical protein GGR34_001604 [Microvirga flocculans]|uniref:Uncharacterized protein n=1 Tax=Microvirga flocculans TaxID=217168 RepID=A0A7W6IEE9_9HYPH|nr:hypothetical protein [Microvirga flocculans]MBB4039957.1 hypothetical protein [Microvirga flocculans]
MVRTILLAAIFLAGLGPSQAQTSCYPRIGSHSGQYEGQCPNSELKWKVFENTIGAFGRNCSDEPWTYNRTERRFFNFRTKEASVMQDCDIPVPSQATGSWSAPAGSEAAQRFYQGQINGPQAPGSRS